MVLTCATLPTELLPGMDWRPLLFEHPLPLDRVCQVCGLVCKETVVLPCLHILCNVCFEGSVALGCVCPLDREVFDQDEVDKLKLRPGHLLKLRVSCWNSAQGCEFVGPVAELLAHFERGCVHHVTPCPRCHQDVPRLGLVQHCVNGCDFTARVESPSPEVTHQEKRLLEDLERASAEIKQTISELKDGYYGLQASVNTVADDVQLGRSEARQAMTEIVSSLLAELQTTQTDVTHQGVQLLEKFEKSGTELKQSIAKLEDGNNRLQTSVNTVADNVKLGRSEARRAKTEILSSLEPQLRTKRQDAAHREGQLRDEPTKASIRTKQPTTPLKDVCYGPKACANAAADNLQPEPSGSEQATMRTCTSLSPQSTTMQSGVSNWNGQLGKGLDEVWIGIKRTIEAYNNTAREIKPGSLQAKEAPLEAALVSQCSEDPSRCPPASESAETLIHIGRRRRHRCIRLPEISSSTPGGPCKVRWTDTVTFQGRVSQIQSDRFVVDGKVAFFRLLWRQPFAHDEMFFRLEVPKGHPFQRPFNVTIVAPQHPHVDICCQVDPAELDEPHIIDLCTLTAYLDSPMQLVVDLEL